MPPSSQTPPTRYTPRWTASSSATTSPLASSSTATQSSSPSSTPLSLQPRVQPPRLPRVDTPLGPHPPPPRRRHAELQVLKVLRRVHIAVNRDLRPRTHSRPHVRIPQARPRPVRVDLHRDIVLPARPNQARHVRRQPRPPIDQPPRRVPQNVHIRVPHRLEQPPCRPRRLLPPPGV